VSRCRAKGYSSFRQELTRVQQEALFEPSLGERDLSAPERQRVIQAIAQELVERNLPSKTLAAVEAVRKRQGMPPPGEEELPPTPEVQTPILSEVEGHRVAAGELPTWTFALVSSWCLVSVDSVVRFRPNSLVHLSVYSLFLVA
jgi:hypothetical protein